MAAQDRDADILLRSDNSPVIMPSVAAAPHPWIIDVCENEQGEKPIWIFIAGLTGRNKVEALVLIKLIEAQGNQLRLPHSRALGDGLFELRGKEVWIFYMFLPKRVIVLLDAEIKKQNAIPARTLRRVRRYQLEVLRRGWGSRDHKA